MPTNIKTSVRNQVVNPGRKPAGLASPRQEQAEATRRRLVNAALRAFSTRSFDLVAVDDIADAAAVAHGLVFHYFGSKRGLYLEALREVARQFGEVHRVAPGGTPVLRIRAMLLQQLQYMSRHRKLALHLFRGGLGTDPEAWRIIDALRAEVSGWMAAELGLDPAPPALQLMLRAMAGASDAAMVYWLTHGRAVERERLLDALLEHLAAALRGAAQLDPTLDVSAALRRLDRRRGG